MALTVSATDVELQKPVNVVFQQTFLRRAQQVCPYFIGASPGQINKQMGTSTIKWRRIEQLTPSTSALTELTTTAAYGQGRNADVPTFADVTATVSKYGQFFIVNEEVDLYNPNGTTNELMQVMGEAGGRSLNQLMRDVMEDNATQRYQNNVASTGAVHAVATVGSFDRIINELTKNAARMYFPLSSGTTNIGTVPILPGYWAICHPDVAYDVAKMTGFVSVEKYAGQVAVAMGEFGLYGLAGRSLRFVTSEDASKDANTGAALSGADLNSTGGSVIDTYATCVFGMDSFGSVGLGMRHADGIYRAGENQGAFDIIFHPRGSGGAADPFDELATLAWKAFYAGAVLNANWSRTLRTGATNLTN